MVAYSADLMVVWLAGMTVQTTVDSKVAWLEQRKAELRAEKKVDWMVVSRVLLLVGSWVGAMVGCLAVRKVACSALMTVAG